MSGAFQADAFQADAFQEALDKSGTGSLALTAVLSATGAMHASGTAAIAESPSFGRAGRKGARGVASITETGVPSGGGEHGGQGSGAIVASAVMGATARKDSTASGEEEGWSTIVLDVTMVATGVKVTADREGTGSLSTVATLAGSGHKDAAGTGSLALTAQMAAAGLSPFVADIPRGRTVKPLIRLKRRGAGRMVIHAEMSAIGRKVWEADDELVLALVA